MGTSQVIDGRFELMEKAGEGGMGVVFRAKDRESGTSVAIKLLSRAGAPERARRGPDRLERFRREALVLQAIQHPHVVRYVASAIQSERGPYLAMEWLNGPSLREYLQGGQRLSPADAVNLVGRIAAAVGVAHAKGVVHRDLKPANIILQDGRLDQPKVIDFGIAHLPRASQHTREGQIVGTPGYIAPEQAQGIAVDSRTDVYALGCLLFRCLTGSLPFRGSVVNVLTKIVLEEAPSLASLLPDAPANLGRLLGRMLAKRPDSRPLDAQEVARRLRDEDLLSEESEIEVTAAQIPTRPRRRLSTSERQVFTVVMAQSLVEANPSRTTDTLIDISSSPDIRSLQVLRLIDGTEVAIIRGVESASEQVGQAIAWALQLAPRLQGGSIAIATGRGMLDRSLPVGEVIDRASELLEETLSRGGDETLTPAMIRIDDATAALLPTRYQAEKQGYAWLLSAESVTGDSLERVLELDRPCFGRRKELRLLGVLADEAFDGAGAQVALLTGAEGCGKSNLAQSFLRSQYASGPRAEVWMATADPMRSGAPLALVTELLRNGLQLQATLTPTERYARLLALDWPAAESHYPEFLAEVLGLPLPGPPSAELLAARRDPHLMAEQARRSLAACLRSCGAHLPLILFLEDIHMADHASLRLLEACLSRASDLRVLLVATSRDGWTPEEHQLWNSLDRQDLHIGPLSRAAITELLHEHLEEKPADALVDSVYRQSEGNAFFATEIIRSYRSGDPDLAPSTVLAMVEARLGSLEATHRQLLRAASVFGETFWDDALRGMMNADFDLESCLAELVREEWIKPEVESRVAERRQYRFRHPLVRQAAYEMLTDEDKALAHRIAGGWLKRSGVEDDVTLANHFELGQRPKVAAPHWLGAAQQALRAGALVESHRYGERAEKCALDSGRLDELLLSQCEAAYWLDDPERLQEKALLLERRLDSRAHDWWHVQRYLLLAEQKLDAEAFRERAGKLLSVELDSVDSTGYAKTIFEIIRYADRLGSTELLDRAEKSLRRLDLENLLEGDLELQGHRANVDAQRALNRGDVVAHVASRQRAVESFRRYGHRLHELNAALNEGYGWMLLGACTRAVQSFEDAMRVGEAMGVDAAVAMANHNLGLVLTWMGVHGRALEVQERALSYARRVGDERIECACLTYLVRSLLAIGAADEALRHAQRAAELGAACGPPFGPPADAVLAQSLLAQGEKVDALEVSQRAYQALADEESLEEGREYIAMVHGLVLSALGKDAESARVMKRAYASLEKRAESIQDAEMRRSFFQNIPEHVTLGLHAEDA